MSNFKTTLFFIFSGLLLLIVIMVKYCAPTHYVKDEEFFSKLHQRQLIIDQSKRNIDSLYKIEANLRLEMEQTNKKLQKDSIKIVNLKLKLNETRSNIDTFSSRNVVEYFDKRYGSN